MAGNGLAGKPFASGGRDVVKSEVAVTLKQKHAWVLKGAGVEAAEAAWESPCCPCPAGGGTSALHTSVPPSAYLLALNGDCGGSMSFAP